MGPSGLNGLAGAMGPRGEPGPKGDPGPRGPAGPEGLSTDPDAIVAAVLSRMPAPPQPDVRGIAAAVVQSIPATPIEIYDEATGEILFSGDLRLGQPLKIPYRPDTPSSFGLEDLKDEDQQALASAIVANLTKENAELLASKLPPAMIHPGYEDENGEILPYKYSKPLAVRLGQVSTLPPNKISVQGPSGITPSQAPIGVPLRIKMNDPRLEVE